MRIIAAGGVPQPRSTADARFVKRGSRRGKVTAAGRPSAMPMSQQRCGVLRADRSAEKLLRGPPSDARLTAFSRFGRADQGGAIGEEPKVRAADVVLHGGKIINVNEGFATPRRGNCAPQGTMAAPRGLSMADARSSCRSQGARVMPDLRRHAPWTAKGSSRFFHRRQRRSVAEVKAMTPNLRGTRPMGLIGTCRWAIRLTFRCRVFEENAEGRAGISTRRPRHPGT